MLRRSPVLDPAELPGRKRRSWPFVVASAVTHVLVLLIGSGVLWKVKEDEPPKKKEDPRQVDVVYLPRPKKEKPLPPTKPEPPKIKINTPKPPTPTPAPPATEAKPEKDPNAPADAKAQSGTREPIADAPKQLANNDAGAKAQEKPTLSTAPVAAQTQESEAKKLFGAHAPADGTEPEPFSIRPFAMPGQGSEKCTPVQRFKRDANGRAPMGITVGRILQEDNVHPLAGAMLQMIGTPYVTYTDDQGEYKFTYDMSLIEDCRQQFVRVTANGFQPRMLTLVIGDKIRSDDVAMQKNGGGLPFGVRGRGARN